MTLTILYDAGSPCRFLLRRTVLILSAALVVFANGGDKNSPAAQEAPDTAAYILGPDDQISVWALGVPEIPDRPMRIDPNGNVDLPLLGSFHAGGQTVEHFKAELLTRLAQYVRQPQVTVSITDFRSQPVSIIGDVKNPGVHQIAGPQKLLEVLSLAGGILPDAGNSINITREASQGRLPLPSAKEDATGKFSVAEVNVDELLRAKNPEENIMIYPHDVISVPRAKLIYVMGEVNKPGGFPLLERDSYSVLQAISLAGGVTHSAALSRAEILRSVAGQTSRRALPLNLANVLDGRVSDIPLQPEDILFVPNNVAKSAGLRAVEAAIQLGTGVIIWR